MENNGFSFLDPNKPRYMVGCEPWEEFPERVLVTEVLRGKRMETRDYVQERTCRKVVGKYGHRWSCSECDETLLPGYPSTRYPDGIVNYCPNCGARVVSEQ